MRKLAPWIALAVIISIAVYVINESPTESADSGTPEPQEFPCPQCGAVFHTQFDVAFHLKWTHGFWA